MARAQLLLTVCMALAVVAAGCSETINDVTNGPSNAWALENTRLADLHERGIEGQGYGLLTRFSRDPAASARSPLIIEDVLDRKFFGLGAH
jgi:hypothetical protein